MVQEHPVPDDVDGAVVAAARGPDDDAISAEPILGAPLPCESEDL
jgi:hypothetical protein